MLHLLNFIGLTIKWVIEYICNTFLDFMIDFFVMKIYIYDINMYTLKCIKLYLKKFSERKSEK